MLAISNFDTQKELTGLSPFISGRPVSSKPRQTVITEIELTGRRAMAKIDLLALPGRQR
jgi:hypothetical protein